MVLALLRFGGAAGAGRVHVKYRGAVRPTKDESMGHHNVYLNHSVFDFLHGDSFALLSGDADVRRAVVFVHGFGGNPTTTFSQMQDLIQVDDSWRGTDAYFVGYDSTDDETNLSAAYLANFIRTIAPQPPSQLFQVFSALVSRSFQVRDPSPYESIDLVGHSLGGVVVRAAILQLLEGIDADPPDTDEEREGELNELIAGCRCNVYLFAPAQGGARVAGLAGRTMNIPGLRTIANIFRGGSPTFQELSPGSMLIQQLREDTIHHAEKYPKLTALRASVAWAEKDDIVSRVNYVAGHST